jgi:hypothetical protein
MIDIHSPTWELVSGTCEHNIANARKRLETQGASIQATEYDRGVIAALNMILALAKFEEAKNLPRDIGNVDY